MDKPILLESPYDVSDVIATGLLQIKAVELRPNDPFTWSSGWKSPIYCDNRLVLSHPVLRSVVADAFQAIVESHFPGVEMIVGAATGGIAHAAIVAHQLGLPTAYVRSSSKGHGKGRRVEGRVTDGMRCIVIEDTLSTGKSAYDVVDALREEGAIVLGVCSIFSYDFESLVEKARTYQVPAFRLLNYEQLIEVARTLDYVSDDDLTLLKQWHGSPAEFGV